MIIQHNISALNAHRQLSINNAQTSSNLEKLSSGYRINRAADDAAGLAISEKMRGQIRGLNMAVQNCDNGISLIQTAEGGLQETHAILQRMRELAVQSANGTYDNENDRSNLNLELNRLKDEIDRISSATHYNGINLLDGSLGGQATQYLKDGLFISPTGTGNRINYTGDSVLALADMFLSFGFQVGHNVTSVPTSSISGRVELNVIDSSLDGGTANLVINGHDTDTDLIQISMLIGDKTYVGSINSSGAQDIYEFMDQDGNVVATLARYDSSGNLDQLMTAGGESGVITGIQLSGSGTTYLLGDPTNPTNPINSAHQELLSDYTDMYEAMCSAIFGFSDSELIFQIGANGTKDQTVGLHVDNMSTANLGTKIPTGNNATGTIADVSVALQDDANDAITIIEAAINQVSAQRAELGALQNRMEHTLNNLGVTAENLTAAESTIRDVDMAKEMMEYTKNSILVQASQSMLAQAQSLPQGVLQLLS